MISFNAKILNIHLHFLTMMKYDEDLQWNQVFSNVYLKRKANPTYADAVLTDGAAMV